MNPPLYSFLLLMMLFADLFAFNGTVGGQGRHGDVMVTVTSEKIIALPASGGAIEEGLAANETVGKTVAQGQTGLEVKRRLWNHGQAYAPCDPVTESVYPQF